MTAKSRRLLASVEVERWVDVVSLWEIAIKAQIGKLAMLLDESLSIRQLQALKAQTLVVSTQHSLALMKSPLHRTLPAHN